MTRQRRSDLAWRGADRLSSSSVTGAVPGATSVADGLAPADITYDVRGNTKRRGDMQSSYDEDHLEVWRLEMTSSDSALEHLLRRLASELREIESLTERKGNVVRLWMRRDASAERTAVVSRHHQLMYVLWLDGTFSSTRMDEDLNLEQEEELLRDLIRIGEQYVLHGGARKSTWSCRAPYVEVQVCGDPIRIYRARGGGDDADPPPWGQSRSEEVS